MGSQRDAVVAEYEGAGYCACWHSGEKHGANAVYRFATFHLDRIDLSPVAAGPSGAMVPLMTLLKATIEHAVPDWVEQARRLGGLLIGVGSQAGRPLSLAHEWRAIADETLRAHEHAGARGEVAAVSRSGGARLRTHLTGLAAA